MIIYINLLWISKTKRLILLINPFRKSFSKSYKGEKVLKYTYAGRILTILSFMSGLVEGGILLADSSSDFLIISIIFIFWIIIKIPFFMPFTISTPLRSNWLKLTTNRSWSSLATLFSISSTLSVRCGKYHHLAVVGWLLDSLATILFL